MKLPNRPLMVASVMVLLTISGAVYLGKSSKVTRDTSSRSDATTLQSPCQANLDPERSAQKAIALALNDLRPSPKDPDQLLLDHPKHTATFSSGEGVNFSPRFSEMTWNWRLEHFGSEAENALKEDHQKPKPLNNAAVVDFDYGAFIERYIPKQETMEQQFILQERPAALGEGEDLVVRGQVAAEGLFEEAPAELGWNWRDEETGKVVSLGQVTVFDAEGQTLPASMLASADMTQITVDGSALSGAAYPVTIDPEIGTNDFLISAFVASGDDVHELPAVGYGLGKFCVAWLKGSPKLGGTSKLYVQLVDTDPRTTEVSGPQKIGEPILISDKATNTRPAVTYAGSRFMVAWSEAKTNAFDSIGKAQLIDRNGNVVLPQAIEVTSEKPHQGNSLTLASDPFTSEEYVLGWIDHRRQVHYRVMDEDGVRIRGDIALGFHAPDGDSDSEVSISSTRMFGSVTCITWVQANVETGGRSVVARVVDSLGGRSDPAIISNGSSRMGSVGVAYNRDPDVGLHYCFVWRDELNSNSGQPAIYNRLMRRRQGGFVPESEVNVIAVAEGAITQVTNPRVTHVEEQDAYAVTWTSHEGEDLSIKATLVDDDTGDFLQSGFEITDEGTDCVTALSFQGERTIDPDRKLNNDRLFAVVSRVGEQRADAVNRPMLGYTMEFPNNVLEVTSDPPIVFDGAVDFRQQSSTPDVAYVKRTDEFVVVWEQEYASAGDWQIMMRRVPGDPSIQTLSAQSLVSNGAAVSDLTAISQHQAPKISTLPGISGSFLVVWQAQTPAAEGPQKEEIYGRAWNGSNEDWTSDPFQISETGQNHEQSGDFSATAPDVVYNSEDHRYLVVWSANGTTDTFLPGNPEIYARHMGATNHILSSVVRKLSNSAAGQLPAVDPAVAYNADENEYMVVWSGSKGDPFTMALKEEEIIGQILSKTALPIGFPEIRVSHMGPILDIRYGARTPDIAYSPAANEYLIVWAGEHDFYQNTEIHGRYVRANGTRRDFEFQISDMGILDDFASLWVPMSPSVTYQEANNAFQVVWTSGHAAPGLANLETEVYIAEVREDGSGPGQVRISDLGPDGDDTFDANNAALAISEAGEYLVVFDGNDDQGQLTPDSNAVFGQHYERIGSGGSGGSGEVPTDPDKDNSGPDKDNSGPDKDNPGTGTPSSGDDVPLRVETDGDGIWLVWTEKQDPCFAIEASTNLNSWETIAEGDVDGANSPAPSQPRERFYRLRMITKSK